MMMTNTSSIDRNFCIDLFHFSLYFRSIIVVRYKSVFVSILL